MQHDLPTRPTPFNKHIVLVLQGGGALGSYQAGVYEALSQAGYAPDWVAGISIGAINAALIAGNPPQHRAERLRQFWEEITQPTATWPISPLLAQAERTLGAVGTVLMGQPGFFAPQPAFSWLLGPQPTSFYDTSALRSTLERLVDFDRINAREMRFSVGAVNVRTGHFAYFDNVHSTIRPEHVMASGALPPGFPAVEIDGQHYWDGGLVSNTPLNYVLNHKPRVDRLIFQVDVFQAYGPLPTTLDEVSERQKDIRFASRTRTVTQKNQDRHNLRSQAEALWEALPEAMRALPQAQFLAELACKTKIDIVHLIYRPMTPQGGNKDFEFDRGSMRARWGQGLSDAETTLHASPWLTPTPLGLGARSFDVLHDSLVAKLGATPLTEAEQLAVS